MQKVRFWDPEHWRFRAEEASTVADQMTHEEARTIQEFQSANHGSYCKGTGQVANLMLGKISIIGAVATISHDPHCTVRANSTALMARTSPTTALPRLALAVAPPSLSLSSTCVEHLHTANLQLGLVLEAMVDKVGYAQPHGKSVGSQLAVHVTE